MRGLFVCPISADLPANRGIVQKMEAERKALAALAGSVDVVSSGREGPYLGPRRFATYPLARPSLSPINHYLLFYRYVWMHCHPPSYDFLYVRYPLALPSFLAFLRATRKANPDTKVIVEVPTFPYRQELRSPKQRVLLALDDLGRHRLKSYVDLVVTFFGQEQIFGVPCFRTNNGIDVERIPLVPSKETSGSVRLIAVANLARWHGLDRLLRGLAAYAPEQRTEVTLDVVGDGPAREELQASCIELGVDASVAFHGMQGGEALDALFAQADLAVGSLGMHRLGLVRSSSLKVREYCARGVPFVLASDDPDFPDTTPYVHRVPADESAIDIREIVHFIEQLRRDHPRYASEMRAYAESRLTWQAKLAPVVDFVRHGELPASAPTFAP